MHNYNVDRKYQYGCRIGNWSEEQDLDEHKMKEYLKKKEQQKLVCSDREDRLRRGLAPVELSFSEDGYLHYGFLVQIQSDFLGGFVATNPAERIPGNEESFAVTVSQDGTPALRNAFQIIRYEKDPLHNDDALRYGQNFRLALSTNPDKSLLLCSSAITPQRCAKFSRKQEVCASVDSSTNSVWTLEYDDPKLRYEMKGEPVRAGEPVLIKHVPTSQWLATDNIVYANEFPGREYEVFCHSFTSHNKTQNLLAEKVGRKTIETPMRNQSNQNIFRIQTALNPSSGSNAFRNTASISQSAFLSSSTKIANQLSHSDLLFKVRRALMNKAGPHALHFFATDLAKADSKNAKVLSDQTFRQAVLLFGITLTEIDIAELTRVFAADQGVVNYVAFLQELGGNLSAQRRALVDAAYDAISEKLGGNVSLNGIFNTFGKTKHPDVLKRYCTEKEAQNDFELSWGGINRHSKISREQFVAYYQDYSACVEKEDFFEVVLKNVWGLSS